MGFPACSSFEGEYDRARPYVGSVFAEIVSIRRRDRHLDELPLTLLGRVLIEHPERDEKPDRICGRYCPRAGPGPNLGRPDACGVELQLDVRLVRDRDVEVLARLGLEAPGGSSRRPREAREDT